MFPETKTIIPLRDDSDEEFSSSAPFIPHRKYLYHSGGPSGSGILEGRMYRIRNESLERELDTHSKELMAHLKDSYLGFAFFRCKTPSWVTLMANLMFCSMAMGRTG